MDLFLIGVEVKMQIDITRMENSCEDVSRLLKSMAHPTRLMILGHLIAGAKTVGELTDLCDISQSQMSHFLMRMSAEGLVNSEKRGKFKYYSVVDERLVSLMKAIQNHYCRH